MFLTFFFYRSTEQSTQLIFHSCSSSYDLNISTSLFCKKTDWKHLCKAASCRNIFPEVSHCCLRGIDAVVAYCHLVAAVVNCRCYNNEWALEHIISRFVVNYEQHVITVIVSICIFKHFIHHIMRSAVYWHIYEFNAVSFNSVSNILDMVYTVVISCWM